MATWDKRHCQSFETAERGFQPGFSLLRVRAPHSRQYSRLLAHQRRYDRRRRSTRSRRIQPDAKLSPVWNVPRRWRWPAACRSLQALRHRPSSTVRDHLAVLECRGSELRIQGACCCGSATPQDECRAISPRHAGRL